MRWDASSAKHDLCLINEMLPFFLQHRCRSIVERKKYTHPQKNKHLKYLFALQSWAWREAKPFTNISIFYFLMFCFFCLNKTFIPVLSRRLTLTRWQSVTFPCMYRCKQSEAKRIKWQTVNSMRIKQKQKHRFGFPVLDSRDTACARPQWQWIHNTEYKNHHKTDNIKNIHTYIYIFI